MKSLIAIIVTTALVNNVVLSQFLGICSFLGVSSQKKASLSLGMAVTAVLTVSSLVAGMLYQYVLLRIMVDVIFADWETMPEFHFDWKVMLVSLVTFLLAYELILYVYSGKIERQSVKSIMLE